MKKEKRQHLHYPKLIHILYRAVLTAVLLAGTGILLVSALQPDLAKASSSTRMLCHHDMEYICGSIWEAYQEEQRQKEASEERALDQWRLVLVNPWNSLEEDYEVKRTGVENGQYVDERIAEELNAMLKAAREDGVGIRVISGYRSYKRQMMLYENKVRRLKRQGYTQEEAEAEAATVVAVPGTSEHMTGLAVDLASEDNTALEEEQENTLSYQWLLKHCMEYGFIVRYPEGKEAVTGIIYEPWHFRYVGRTHAEIIMKNGWCLEEYLERYPDGIFAE